MLGKRLREDYFHEHEVLKVRQGRIDWRQLAPTTPHRENALDLRPGRKQVIRLEEFYTSASNDLRLAKTLLLKGSGKQIPWPPGYSAHSQHLDKHVYQMERNVVKDQNARKNRKSNY